MKIFLSWSGTRSRAVAEALHGWLPKVIQKLQPWISAANIDKGSRWGVDIAKNLEQSRFGLICLTPENLDKPWILFEAGALSKNLGTSFVAPYLFDFEGIEIKGPLAQFQATKADKDDTKKLVATINKSLGRQKLPEGALDATFEKWWPELEAKLRTIADDPAHNKSKYRLRHSEEYEEDIQEYAKTFKKLLDRYGLEAARTSVGVEILDLQGKSRFRRSYQGIKVTSSITVAYIPGSIATSIPESKFIKYPTLYKPIDFKKRLTLVRQVLSTGKCNFQVRIQGNLMKGDPKLSYGYESIISKAFYMTKEDVEEAYKNEPFRYEYFAAEPEIPTGKMVVEVEFPESFKVEPYPGVFMGRFDFLHESELQRTKPGFRKTKKGARFEIQEPLIGFNYLIYWLPP